MTDPKEMRLLRQEINEEMKDELKKQDIRLNKLCFDYYEKDKRIEKLEKENEKLKKHNEELIALINAERERQEKCDDVHLRKIAELEKENAELKETLKTYNGCGDWDNDFHACRVYLQHEELQMYIDQLTKAKEIIKNLLQSLYCWEAEVELDEIDNSRIEQAEQFLKEIEK